MTKASETPTTGSGQFRVRPLLLEDGETIAALMVDIYRELGAEPQLGYQATIDLFKTPWLARGAGLVLEDSGSVGGYGWARDVLWNGREIVQLGLFLRPACRMPGVFEILTDPLMALAKKVGRQYGAEDALVYYRSIDEVHPPIIRSLGFHDLPTSMLGFRHDLKRWPTQRLPKGLVIRPASLESERRQLLALGRDAYDDPVSQGEPLHEQYFDLIAGRPGFAPEQILIAELAGVPVGRGVVMANDHGPKGGAEIADVCVLPEHRRKRIGACIVSRMLDWCRRARARSLLTATFSTNPAAVLLWQLGFRPDPMRTYYYFLRRLSFA